VVTKKKSVDEAELEVGGHLATEAAPFDDFGT
jgi:hypothetical protein